MIGIRHRAVHCILLLLSLWSVSSDNSVDCTDYKVLLGGLPLLPAWPDTSSRYDSYFFSVSNDASDPNNGNYDYLLLKGEYPYARFFSVTLYDVLTSLTAGSLADYQIQPLPGNNNTFLPGADRMAQNRAFQIYVIPPNSNYQPPDGSNVLKMSLYTSLASILLRLYVPDTGGFHPLAPFGGVDTPRIYAMTNSSTSPTCPVGNLKITDVAGLVVKPDNLMQFWVWAMVGLPLDSVMFFRNQLVGLFPNSDNQYIVAPMKLTGVAVITFEPPTFENNNGADKEKFDGSPDVRYFSFCLSGLQITRTVACIYDAEMIGGKLDENGMLTLVVGPTSLRDQTVKKGYLFLERGTNVYRPYLVHRHMLDAPDFSGRIGQVPEVPYPLPVPFKYGAYDAVKFMGNFAPRGKHMTTLRYTIEYLH